MEGKNRPLRLRRQGFFLFFFSYDLISKRYDLRKIRSMICIIDDKNKDYPADLVVTTLVGLMQDLTCSS